MTAQAGGASFLRRDVHAASAAARNELRITMRARRRALSSEHQELVAQRVAQAADQARLLRPNCHIAMYLRHGSEVDLRWLIARAHKRGCRLYLPVIADYRAARMEFHRYEPGEELQANRFGILEPQRSRPVSPLRLDLVFAPLVAFDLRGARLGSGAGFYDRALKRLAIRRRWRRPRLIGVGYDVQQVEELGRAAWDVPLDGVLTETGFTATRCDL